MSYEKHVIHVFISLVLLLIALTIISRWERADGLAGVSPYDTIIMPTVVVETPLPNLPIYETHSVTTNISSNTPLEVARRERKIICHEAYQEQKDKVKNHDKIVERCAAMMTLNFAFESGHGRSRLCEKQNNCHGIKSNKRDRCIKGGTFCSYSTKSEGMRDWAEMYIRYYSGYETIKSYLNVYDPTHHGTYYQFVTKRYEETLNYFIIN